MPRIKQKTVPQTLVILAMLGLGLTARMAAAQTVQTQWGPVSKPEYSPHICNTLKANLTSVSGRLDDSDPLGKASQPDHDRIQSAIQACDKGAVKLVLGAQGQDGFLSGPLVLKSSVKLWIDKGVTLFASRNPKDYDNGIGDCGTANKETKKSCLSLITAPNTNGAGLEGEGAIDGRGGSLLTGGPNAGKASWWDLAWLTKSGLVQHNFRLMQIDDAKDFTLVDITLLNSPNFHFVSNSVDGITAWGIKMLTPSLAYSRQNYDCPKGTRPDETPLASCFTPDTVKNTDGFDPGQSQHVLLAYGVISVGDDQVAIKAHGKAPMRLMHLAHNYFYYGHGLSIGSETDSGDSDIVSDDLVMDGMDSPNGNGLRIKSDSSRGGQVRRITYMNTCMKNVRFPLVFDTAYSDKTGALYPDFADITVSNFTDAGSQAYGRGTWILRGFNEGSTTLPVKLHLEHMTLNLGAPKLSGHHSHLDTPPQKVELSLGPDTNALRADMKSAPENGFVVTDAPATYPRIQRDCALAFKPLKALIPNAPF